MLQKLFSWFPLFLEKGFRLDPVTYFFISGTENMNSTGIFYHSLLFFSHSISGKTMTKKSVGDVSSDTKISTRG
jgi:hypothetical protein